MKLTVMCIEDLETGKFQTPFFVEHVSQGVRGLIQARENPQSELHLFADNFMVHRLGLFCTDTGAYEDNPNSAFCLVSELRYASKTKAVTDMTNEEKVNATEGPLHADLSSATPPIVTGKP